MDYIGSDSYRTARKEHTCWLCGKKISKGEEYVNTFNVDCGQGFDFKRHRLCNDAMVLLEAPEDGWTQDDFSETLSTELNVEINKLVPKGATPEGADIFIDTVTPETIEGECEMYISLCELNKLKREKL